MHEGFCFEREREGIRRKQKVKKKKKSERLGWFQYKYLTVFIIFAKPLVSLQPIAKICKVSFVVHFYCPKHVVKAPSFTFRCSTFLLPYIRPPLISYPPPPNSCSQHIFSTTSTSSKCLTLELSLVNILHHQLLTLQNFRQVILYAFVYVYVCDFKPLLLDCNTPLCYQPVCDAMHFNRLNFLHTHRRDIFSIASEMPRVTSKQCKQSPPILTQLFTCTASGRGMLS